MADVDKRLDSTPTPVGLSPEYSTQYSGLSYMKYNEAVRHDLESDFNYPHEESFVIEEAKPFDTAKTKDGKELTRLLVWVGAYKRFDTTKIDPVDAKPFWAYEGEDSFNLITKYFK